MKRRGVLYSVFEYLYRDAGNWKTHGSVLLTGEARSVGDAIRACCEWGDLFVAEQIGIPSLCERHWTDCGDGPSELDHAYHEFVELRPASDEEIATMAITDALSVLLERLRACAGRWDVTRSPNWTL